MEKVHNDGVSGRGADLNYASERIGQDRRNQRHEARTFGIRQGTGCDMDVHSVNV